MDDILIASPQPQDAEAAPEELRGQGSEPARRHGQPTDGDLAAPPQWEDDAALVEAAENRAVEVTAAQHRVLKLVVTLRSTDGSGYRALIGVGADGCDPLLRCVEAADLAAVLAEVPGLLAEAEARWQAQPRARTPAPPKAQRATAANDPPESEPPRRDAARPPRPASPGPMAAPARTGQISFLG